MFDILSKMINSIPFFTQSESCLEKEKKCTLKVMELAKVHFLSPYQDRSFWHNAKRNINGTEYIVHRFNHGLAHSLRQGALAKDIFKTLINMKSEYQELDSQELEELAEWTCQKDQNDRDFIYKIELASSFQRSGRQSEGSSSSDLQKYMRYEKQDVLNFRHAAISSGLFKNTEERKIFEEAILWTNKGELDEDLIPDLKFLRGILHSAHTFDLRRMPAFDPLRICQDGMNQLLGKSINLTNHYRLIEQIVWKRAGEYLEATGDRDLMERGSLDNKFFFQTANPKTIVDAIYKIRKTSLSTFSVLCSPRIS